jgi:ubiquinone/menaquinone biosynthesis C-methylase UbiE
MTKPRVNYDQIAPTYDRRFAHDRTEGIGQALLGLAQRLNASRILEVGCGTCHWLAQMHRLSSELYGLDLSPAMLNQAQRRRAGIGLVNGYARQLPFESDTFDLVFCVNAIHHFQDPRGFVSEAARVLRRGGALAVVGNDPHGRRESWFAYRYFDGVYETDLQRFPAWKTVHEWMIEDGFEEIEWWEVERIVDPKYGRGVFDDPFLKKNSCSQLALLTEEAYQAGLERIESDLVEAEAKGETLVFEADILIAMLAGRKTREQR